MTGPIDYAAGTVDPGRAGWFDAMRRSNGVFYGASQTRVADITDGTSNTYLIGEKYLNSDAYTSNTDAGDDQNMFTGYQDDVIRWTGPGNDPAYAPRRTKRPPVFSSSAARTAAGSTWPYAMDRSVWSRIPLIWRRTAALATARTASPSTPARFDAIKAAGGIRHTPCAVVVPSAQAANRWAAHGVCRIRELPVCGRLQDGLTMNEAETYSHTQKASSCLLLYAFAVIFLAASWLPPLDELQIVLLVAGLSMFVLAASFHHLTVADEGYQLAIRFGPLPLFRKRIWYEDIWEVETGRSTFLDGWGIPLEPRGGSGFGTFRAAIAW